MKCMTNCTPTGRPVRPRAAWDVRYFAPGGAGPAMVLDYATGIFGLNGVRGADPMQFSRASDAAYWDRGGRLRIAGSGVRRIGYDPATALPQGMIIEGASTNVLLRSSDFSNVAWVKSQAVVVPGQFTDPTGDGNMVLLREDTTTGAPHTIYQNASGDTGLVWSFSVFVRPAGRDKIKLRLLGIVTSVNYIDADIDLAAGTASVTRTAGAGTDGVARVKKLAADGSLWRVSISGTPVPSGGPGMVRGAIFTRDAAGAVIYDGDGASGVGIWGAQLEQLARSSSYIATTTAPVTRAADTAAVPVGSWFNPAAGTVLVEFIPEGALTSEWVWALNDGTISNRLDLRLAERDTVYGALNNGGANEIDAVRKPQTEGAATVTALAFAANDIAASWNGGTPKTDTSVIIPGGVTQLEIGRLTNQTRALSGTIRRLIFYPSRLPDTDLQALTAR